MNITSFGYKGIVTLKLKIKDKVVNLKRYNTGTEYLQKVFCKFLTGNYGGSGDIPQKLDLRYDGTSILNQEIGLTGKVYVQVSDVQLDIQDAWVARFTASIPFVALREQIVSANEYELCLVSGFNSDTNSYEDLAHVTIPGEDLEKISPGTQALIEWNMMLVNPTE